MLSLAFTHCLKDSLTPPPRAEAPGGRGAVVLPPTSLALLLASPHDFSSNPDPSRGGGQEPLGPLFATLTIMQGPLGLQAGVVDLAAWAQLRGLRERQLYVLQLLRQAAASGSAGGRLAMEQR